jgi:hypothetical protein
MSSIPNAPRTMMRYHVHPILFFLLRQVVQEEVNQYSVDFRVRFEGEDLSAKELDGPDAATYPEISDEVAGRRARHTSYLHFPGMARLDHLETSDLVFQGWAVPNYAEGVEHLWYAIVLTP